MSEVNHQGEQDQQPAAGKPSLSSFFRKNKKQVLQILKWIGILLLFLIITNPSLIPFLSDETKANIQATWGKVFGDVTKIAKSVTINFATIFTLAAIIMALIIIKKIAELVLSKLNPKKPKTRSLITLLRSALSYVVVIIGIFWCLSAVGVNVSTIFASVGILALIIGFGAQSLVEDMVTGVFLVFEDQFNVGDIIEVEGFRGTVESIGLRTTAIRDVGNNVKVINNSDLRNILNKSTASSFAVTTCSISYNQDVDEAEAKIQSFLPKIREKYPEIFRQDPKYVGVQELGESGVILKFIAEVSEKDVFSAPRILNREIKVWFDKLGIEIPFNQIVIHNAKD